MGKERNFLPATENRALVVPGFQRCAARHCSSDFMHLGSVDTENAVKLPSSVRETVGWTLRV